MNRVVHPIEALSYRILRSTVDTTGLQPRTRDVVERIVHTTADAGWIGDLVTDESALAHAAQMRTLKHAPPIGRLDLEQQLAAQVHVERGVAVQERPQLPPVIGAEPAHGWRPDHGDGVAAVRKR